MLKKSLFINSLLLTSLLCANLESYGNPRFQRFSYKPRTGMGIPQNSLGGTTRSVECASQCVLSLTPADNIPLTALERPSFFFFVPKMQGAKAKFQLFDQNDRVYQTSFDLTSTGGIMEFSLPADAPGLEVGKNYQWRIVIRNSEKTNDLNGFVRRVNLSTVNMTTKATGQPLQAAEIYAQEGIWLDMFKTLVDAKTPETIALIQDLLKSAKFEAIATQPLLECCKSSN